jgi:MFS family permease
MLSLYRPMKLLIFSPIILLLALSLGIIFGYIYLLFTTFPSVFGDVYKWNEGIIGLSYLGCGVGFMIGLFLVGATNDKLVNTLTKKNGVRKPEYRMAIMMFATPLISIGLFWYGWAADKKAHWYESTPP